MRSEKGRIAHQRALDAQEWGEFLNALVLEDEAMIAYQTDGDELGFSEIQAMRALTYRHLFSQTGYEGYLIKAKHEAEASLDLAEKAGDEATMSLALVGVGRILYDLGEYQEAAKNFERAIEAGEKAGERKSVLADYKVHRFVSLILAGDKSLIDSAEEALEELVQSSDASEYEMEVWTSGAHMKIAEALSQNDSNRTREHMELAKKIIDSDPKLKLRLEQWNKLSEKLRN